ncbi:MAG: hypothetical protein KME54_18930 [Tolypothrix brevis GSE-NOS-MK-07-07A]|nr:hypothetical protein [Tolypothrix brevis GSE-NOS-MK-07-07A]
MKVLVFATRTFFNRTYIISGKDVPAERLYQGCDIFINVNYQDLILYHVGQITYTVKTFRRNVSTRVAIFLLMLIIRT